MLAERRAYLDTSGLAKWYLNESGSDVFVSFLQSLDSARISSLTLTEMRSLLSRCRLIVELTTELESLLFAAFLEDIDRGWLHRYPVDDARFTEPSKLIALPRPAAAQPGCPASHPCFPSGNPDARHR